MQAHARAGSASFGLALALIGAGGLVSMRLSGAVLDRLGARGLPLAGLALSVSTLLPPAARSPGLLAVTLAILGVTSGAFDVAVNAEGTRYETDTGQPLLNLGHALFSVGVVAGSAGTAVERSLTSSLALPFGAAAAAVAVASLVSARLPAAVLTGPGTRREALGRRLPRPLLLLGLLGALAYFVENSWQSWGAAHLRRSLDASSATAALAPACFAAAAAAGRLAGHGFTRRIAKRTLVAAGAAVGAIGTLAAALTGEVWMALAAIAVAGLGTSVCAPTLLSLAGDAASAVARNSAISIVTTFSYAGFLIGPAVVGVVASASSLRAAFGVVAVVALGLSGLSVWLLGGRRERAAVVAGRT